MDQDTRMTVCRCITGICVVDDHLAESEDAFVDRLLDRFGLEPEDRGFLFPIMDGDEAGELLAEMDEIVQREAFDLLLEAAAADGHYVEAEREYIHAVAKIVNFDPADADRRIEEMLEDAEE